MKPEEIEWIEKNICPKEWTEEHHLAVKKAIKAHVKATPIRQRIKNKIFAIKCKLRHYGWLVWFKNSIRR